MNLNDESTISKINKKSKTVFLMEKAFDRPTEITDADPPFPHDTRAELHPNIIIPEIGKEIVTEATELSARDQFILSQKSNRYSSFHLLPYSIYIEGVGDIFRNNIGNLHPMSLGKILCKKCSHIKNIKRIGKNLINVNFDSYKEIDRT